MKTALFILLYICSILSIPVCAQSKLKNGVYEFVCIPDSIPRFSELEVRHRTLIVRNNDLIYEIKSHNNRAAAIKGIHGDYYLTLKKTSGNSYKTSNENIQLTITSIESDIIEVEVIEGSITYYYSGGMFYKYSIPLFPEKQILTFTRTLTSEDEKKLNRQ